MRVEENNSGEEIDDLSIIADRISNLNLRQAELAVDQARVVQEVEGLVQQLLQLCDRHLHEEVRPNRGEEVNIAVPEQVEREAPAGAAYGADIIPEVGHRVRIRNPKKGQAKRGTVVGFCRDGKVKIKPEGNQNTREIIVRAAHNLILLP